MIGLDLLAAHMLGDYVLQTNWMAKRKLSEWRVRLLHVLLYAIPFALIAVLRADPPQSAAFVGLLIVTHFITDSRRWASGEAWPPKPILVDQTIHLVTLAVLARLLVP